MWPPSVRQRPGRRESSSTLTAASRPTRASVTPIVIPAVDGRIPPDAIVAALAARGYRRMLVEGGSRTLSMFLAAGALDRLHLCIAPMVIGSGPIGISLPPIDRLDAAVRPRTAIHHLGGDVLFDCALDGSAADPATALELDFIEG